jgi:AraC-like DNA-binding protein
MRSKQKNGGKMNIHSISALKDLDFGILNLSSKEKRCVPGFRLTQGKGRPRHGFLCVLEGKGEYVLSGEKKLIVKKDDIVYMPKNSTYESRASVLECYSYVIVNMDIIDNSKSDIVFSNDISILLNSANSSYKNIFQEINNTFITTSVASGIKCKSLVYEMLYHLALDLFKNELEKDKYANIYKSILYLENNYHENISVKELAGMSHLSMSHFRKLFTEHFNMPPIEYVNRLKIKKACELLKSGNYTVGETAERMGFSNIYYFSRVFKNITGVSPKKINE